MIDRGDGPVEIPLFASASGVSIVGSMAPLSDGLTMSPCAEFSGGEVATATER